MSTLIKLLFSRFRKGLVTTSVDADNIEVIGQDLKKLISAKLKRSFNIREVDTGSCGACEAEIIAANNPIYDISQYGISFVASPRHADALLVTGPVSKNMVMALKKTYAAMPGPKLVISCGDCALDGGIFKGSYYVAGGVGNILPVDFHIPGCPPSPKDIIRIIYSFLKT
ncbi:hydrogenase [candidate division WOR-1 bacterium RIFOXYB2_FULL_42_35]|uniref:Hydrogenase n=1 Tax=candidate division WOR-1 bacterium RIFOXYC2_FULL_41_25 TaxID=1802586 RepID=A0A1F4TRG1_UNCSA|nr:MAG: hydrogenase [candidate division WOR-1 bacterium RIFOXYA2_FULL_41_14]OGC25605.1 MAG: hydrogenase [candidate division WOR-1 bacterium RIFOXYB2_FULL_42_35]OGC35315.1 MAG: hydrogenase [candidate division WOR-1 bacterium RIFOXYC2_FULL_41_25]OGC41973.1 MAG: hydrogenase [candidate division WOR-1 bacterium RIFOXYD2_FULL_41_8]